MEHANDDQDFGCVSFRLASKLGCHPGCGAAGHKVFRIQKNQADRLAIMGDEFMKKSKELEHRAELFTAEGQPHGFFNRSPWQEKTTLRMDEFLVSIGYLPSGEQ